VRSQIWNQINRPLITTNLKVWWLFETEEWFSLCPPCGETFVYYQSMEREVKTRPIYECRCDEGLKTKSEESTCLSYTGFLGELEHLKMQTRLIDEMFASVMGEYVFLK
jgi:hypothetical protein